MLCSFADRRYLPDGRLAPRSDPEALVTSAEEVPDGVVSMARQQRVVAVDGTVVPCPVESICVHGDTPGGVALAQRARAALDEAGVELAPFA